MYSCEEVPRLYRFRQFCFKNYIFFCVCYYLRIFRVLKHVLQYPSYSSITYQQFHLHTCLGKMCVLGVLYMSFMFLLRVHVLRIIKRSSCFCQRKLMTTRVLILLVFFTHFYSTMSSYIEFLVI